MATWPLDPSVLQFRQSPRVFFWPCLIYQSYCGKCRLNFPFISEWSRIACWNRTLKNCLTTFHLLQGSQNLYIFITYEWAHYLCDFLLLSQPCSGFVWKSPQYSYWFQACLPPAREPWSVTNKEVLIEMRVQSKYSPYRSVCEKYDKDRIKSKGDEKAQRRWKLNISNFPLNKSFY